VTANYSPKLKEPYLYVFVNGRWYLLPIEAVHRLEALCKEALLIQQQAVSVTISPTPPKAPR
jgi:hypothetical protein